MIFRFLAALCIVFLGSAGPVFGELKLTFEDLEVSVTGVTKGGDVALFGVAREPREWVMSVVLRQELLKDTDADGAVRYRLETKIPIQSIWALVDVASGEVVTGSPGGFRPEIFDLPAGRLRLDSGGASNRLISGRGRVHAMWVRPGKSAWTITAGDGGPLDEDGLANSAVLVPLDRSVGLGSEAAAPPGVAPRDVLIVIDPDDMSLAVRLPADRGNGTVDAGNR